MTCDADSLSLGGAHAGDCTLLDSLQPAAAAAAAAAQVAGSNGKRLCMLGARMLLDRRVIVWRVVDCVQCVCDCVESC